MPFVVQHMDLVPFVLHFRLEVFSLSFLFFLLPLFFVLNPLAGKLSPPVRRLITSKFIGQLLLIVIFFKGVKSVR